LASFSASGKKSTFSAKGLPKILGGLGILLMTVVGNPPAGGAGQIAGPGGIMVSTFSKAFDILGKNLGSFASIATGPAVAASSTVFSVTPIVLPPYKYIINISLAFHPGELVEGSLKRIHEGLSFILNTTYHAVASGVHSTERTPYQAINGFMRAELTHNRGFIQGRGDSAVDTPDNSGKASAYTFNCTSGSITNSVNYIQRTFHIEPPC
jgi:hypothetical protein